MSTVLKSGSVNHLEPSDPVQACSGIALLFPTICLAGQLVRCWSFSGMRSDYVHGSEIYWLIFVNNQFDAQFFFNLFISFLYMFRAALCPSSGELIVSIRHLVYVTLYRLPFGVQVWMRRSLIQTCTPNSHLYRVTYTRCRIDTINSPDDGHMAARNM